MVPVPRELGMNTNRVEYIGHKPVMVHEVLNLLKNLDSGVLIDATFGSGGHSSEILSLYPKFHVIGIDRDLDSIESIYNTLLRQAQILKSEGGYGSTG